MKIDEWMPEYLVSARYSVLVRASLEQTYAALTEAKFSDLAIVRGLIRLRGYRPGKERVAAASPPNDQSHYDHPQYGAFLPLAMVAEREVLLGIAGRFWRPDGGIVRNLTPEGFRSFHRDGYAKAVWNFSLAAAPNGTQLSTETRVQTLGRAATVKFRLYWLLVGPFSGIMRRAMLGEVKGIAERGAE